jgi:hypothetical protein
MIYIIILLVMAVVVILPIVSVVEHLNCPIDGLSITKVAYEASGFPIGNLLHIRIFNNIPPP